MNYFFSSTKTPSDEDEIRVWRRESERERFEREKIALEKQKKNIAELCATGKGFIVRRLLEHFPELIHKRNKKWNTPLIIACKSGLHRVIEKIIKIDPTSIHQKGYKKKTPLTIAWEKKDEYMIQILYRSLDKDFIGKDGDSMLMIALRYRMDWEHLIDEKTNPNHTNNKGETALYWAAAKRNLKAVERLLTFEDVDPDIMAEDKKTPLTHAISYKNEKIVKLLLDTGKVNPRNGYAALYHIPYDYTERMAEKIFKIVVMLIAADKKINGSCSVPIGYFIEQFVAFLYFRHNMDVKPMIEYTLKHGDIETNSDFLALAKTERRFSRLFMRLNRACEVSSEHKKEYCEIFLVLLQTGKFDTTIDEIVTMCPTIAKHINLMRIEIPNLMIDFKIEVDEVSI